MTQAISPQANDILNAPQDPDAKLIVNGRYKIIPENSTKPKLHTRVTTFAKALDDTYNLSQWGKRMVLLGAAHRQDIQVAALAAHDDKKKLNELAEEALDAAKANVRREMGTALHRLTERYDAGETLELPDTWQRDIAAYATACKRARLTVEMTEQVCILPQLELAGRFDRIYRQDGELVIGDLKTGESLDFSWGSIAIQLALYAAAKTTYDPATQLHTPMPPVNQERAIVVHLPAGSGECAVYHVDLEAGRRGIELVRQVRDWRKTARSVATALTAPDDSPAPPELRAYAEARVRGIIDGGMGGELAAAWPKGVPTLKARPDHLEVEIDDILAACSVIEGRHEMRFPDISDPRQTLLTPAERSDKQRKEPAA